MPRPELVCYACARVDSSKVGCSVPRLETMTSFRQVPEHNTNLKNLPFKGGGFRPKYYRVSRHLLPSMCTFLWQLFYECPVLLQVSPEGGAHSDQALDLQLNKALVHRKVGTCKNRIHVHSTLHAWYKHLLSPHKQQGIMCAISLTVS